VAVLKPASSPGSGAAVLCAMRPRTSGAAVLCAAAALCVWHPDGAAVTARTGWPQPAPDTVALQQRTLSLSLFEDVTHPAARRRFLAEFRTAKAQRAGAAGARGGVVQRDPLSGSVARRMREGRPLTAAQQAAVAAHLKALRRKILGPGNPALTRFAKRVECSYPYPAAACKQ